jgi:DNA-binding GntR family transcriptional regulator
METYYLSPRKPATLADSLFDRLRQALVAGDIPPGTKISEPELARSFGVSRGPLREAIGRLEACGLVSRRPNVGARVVSLSAADLVEIYHVREALEGMAARLAAERMSEGEIAAMQVLLEQHRRQVEREDGQAYFQKEGDLDFHYRIVQGSRNERLIQLLCNDLYDLVRMYRYQFGMASRRARRALEEHAQIVDAIGEHDGESAELLMRRHIRASRMNIERLLEDAWHLRNAES